MYESLEKNGLSLNETVKATHGEPHNFPAEDIYVYSICTDTRENVSNCLFVPLAGENFNGHDFIFTAFEKGALCTLTQEKINTDKPYILVKNTLAAYGDIAAAYKKKFKTMTVAVTGSVGKTTTKESVCAVLGAKYNVCKTKANHNNEVGLPQTLLGLTSRHHAAVVELGMVAKGEISALSKIASPDIAIITNIGTSHIEFLGSRENILNAKLEITDGMNDSGILILNGDDVLLRGVSNISQLCVFVGIENENCDFRALNIRHGKTGVAFDLCFDGGVMRDMFFPSLGRHSVYAALFGAACGVLCGLGEDEIRRGLAAYVPVDMRQKIIRKNGVVIIEDCYNASPESMRASIDVLKYINLSMKGHSVAVLGEMRELGKFGPELHRNVGRYAAERVDMLFLFGDGINIKSLAEGYGESGRAASMLGGDVEKAYKYLSSIISEGDTVLFKASRAVKLERLAEMM